MPIHTPPRPPEQDDILAALRSFDIGTPNDIAASAWAISHDPLWLAHAPYPNGPTLFENLWNRARQSRFDPQWAELLAALVPMSGLANRRFSTGRLPIAEASSFGDRTLPLVQACALAGANPFKKGSDRRSAITAARSCGAKLTQAWLAQASDSFDPHETDSVKEDLAEGIDGQASSNAWQTAFVRESESRSSTFDIDCAWLATRRWGAPAASRMWAACERDAMSDGSFAEWLICCAWGAIAMPSREDLKPWNGRLFSRWLGKAAATLCSRERSHMDPERVESLLDALALCCDLSSARASEAFSFFGDATKAWGSDAQHVAAQALRRAKALHEAQQLRLAAGAAPLPNTSSPPRL